MNSKRLFLLFVAALLASNPSFSQDEDKLTVEALAKFRFPVGLTLPFAGVDTPLARQTLYDAGWFFADGCTLDEREFFSLWLVARDKFGTAPAGRYRIPDLRGRIPMGAGTGTALTTRSFGDQVGEEAHALSGSELPHHTHYFSTRTSDVAETHWGYAGRGLPATDGDNHTHNVSGNTSIPQNAQSGTPANIVQPSLVTNYLVFYGAKTSKMPKKVIDACTVP